ncbi:MAG: hypothetical protein QXE05_06180 [Nitrososphaeria archaeon]|nr:hypothetical protein [Candidatus Parvarchaeum tengchongense]
MKKRALLKIIIKSIVFAILVFILSLGTLGIIKENLNLGILGYFTSLAFLYNFFILIFLMAIYDAIASRRLYMYENLITVLLISLAVSYLSLSLFLVAVIVFVSVFLGAIVGGFLKMYAMKAGIKKSVSGAIFLIIIILFAYVIALHTNYFAPPTVIINVNKPYLTHSQLNNVFGYGIYSENPLSISATGMGSSLYVFPTPIKEDLLYDVSLSNIAANGGFLVKFYNFTFVNNLRVMYANITAQMWDTPQASLLFGEYAVSLKKTPNNYINLGSANGMQYVVEEGVINNTTPSFLIVTQESNYLTFLSCYGLLCTNKNALALINQTSNNI